MQIYIVQWCPKLTMFTVVSKFNVSRDHQLVTRGQLTEAETTRVSELVVTSGLESSDELDMGEGGHATNHDTANDMLEESGKWGKLS